MASGGARTESGKTLLQGSSRLLDSVDRRGMILRRCYGGQEDRRWAGGEELRRGQSSPAAVRWGNSGAAQAEVGEEGLGVVPGPEAEPVRCLAGAPVHRSGVAAVAQSGGTAGQRGGGG